MNTTTTTTTRDNIYRSLVSASVKDGGDFAMMLAAHAVALCFKPMALARERTLTFADGWGLQNVAGPAEAARILTEALRYLDQRPDYVVDTIKRDVYSAAHETLDAVAREWLQPFVGVRPGGDPVSV